MAGCCIACAENEEADACWASSPEKSPKDSAVVIADKINTTNERGGGGPGDLKRETKYILVLTLSLFYSSQAVSGSGLSMGNCFCF